MTKLFLNRQLRRKDDERSWFIQPRLAAKVKKYQTKQKRGLKYLIGKTISGKFFTKCLILRFLVIFLFRWKYANWGFKNRCILFVVSHLANYHTLPYSFPIHVTIPAIYHNFMRQTPGLAWKPEVSTKSLEFWQWKHTYIVSAIIITILSKILSLIVFNQHPLSSQLFAY